MDAFLNEGKGAEAGGLGGSLNHSLRPPNTTGIVPVKFYHETARQSKHALTDHRKVRKMSSKDARASRGKYHLYLFPQP